MLLKVNVSNAGMLKKDGMCRTVRIVPNPGLYPRDVIVPLITAFSRFDQKCVKVEVRVIPGYSLFYRGIGFIPEQFYNIPDYHRYSQFSPTQGSQPPESLRIVGNISSG